MKLHPIVLGVGTGIILLLALAPFVGSKLGELSTLRQEHARLAVVATQPADQATLLPVDQMIAAPDAKAARAHIVTRVRERTKAAGLLLEAVRPVEVAEPLVAINLQISGTETSVVAFADALEREKPMLRFRNWKIQSVAGGVQLSGDLVAVAQ